MKYVLSITAAVNIQAKAILRNSRLGCGVEVSARGRCGDELWRWRVNTSPSLTYPASPPNHQVVIPTSSLSIILFFNILILHLSILP
jgi:hypothetical protein